MKLLTSCIIGLLFLTCAHAQQETRKPPKDITLSAEEIEAGRKASAPIGEATVMVNDLLIVAAHHRPTRNAQGDRDKLADMGSRLVMIAGALKTAEADYSTWLDSIRKTHKCDSCILQDGKLIPKQ